MKLLSGRHAILEFAGVSDDKWNDWQWQKQRSVMVYPNDHNKEEKLATLFRWLQDSTLDLELLSKLADVWAINITPHTALQLVRLRENGQLDWYAQMLRYLLPTSERLAIKVPQQFVREGMGTEERRMGAYPDLPWSVTRLYDNRIVVRASTICAVACQFCFRQHDVAEHHELEKHVRYGMRPAVEYVRKWNDENPKRRITDVILSGGDPLSLSDNALAKAISAFKEIDGVELVRIDTKYPTALPQRITLELVQLLRTFQPVMVSIHFTHPGELCAEVKRACDLMADNGIMLASHTPLLRGVNDDRETLKTLFWNEFVQMRTRPHLLIHTIETPGTDHFRVPLERGLEIMKFLEVDLSGPAHPHFIVYGTKGGGKIHLLPSAIKNRSADGWAMETWVGEEFYPDPIS